MFETDCMSSMVMFYLWGAAFHIRLLRLKICTESPSDAAGLRNTGTVSYSNSARIVLILPPTIPESFVLVFRRYLFQFTLYNADISQISQYSVTSV